MSRLQYKPVGQAQTCLRYDLARTCGIAAAVSTLLLISLFLVSYAMTFVDKKIYRIRAADSVAAGVLIERAPFFLMNPPYRHMQNDCLILSMLATQGPGSRSQRALSPATPALAPPAEYRSIGYDQSRLEPRKDAERRGTPRAEHCFLTKLAIKNNTSAFYYHRYIHGHWLVASVLISILSFKTASLLLFLVPILVSLSTIVMAASNSHRYPLSARDVSYMLLSVGYIAFSGVTFFAWSIDLALAEIILTSFIMFCYRNPLSDLSDRSIAVMSAVLGSLCISFEFLTGLIPSALTLLMGLLALDHSLHKSDPFRGFIIALSAFVASVVCALALKAGAVVILFGFEEIMSSATTLARHLSSDTWEVSVSTTKALSQVGISAAQVKEFRVLSYVFALAKLAYFSDLLTFGYRPLGIIVGIGGSLGFALWSALNTFRLRSLERSNMLLFFACCAVPFSWTFVMLNHSVVNAIWMQRMFVWPTLVGLALAGGHWTLCKKQRDSKGRYECNDANLRS